MEPRLCLLQNIFKATFLWGAGTWNLTTTQLDAQASALTKLQEELRMVRAGVRVGCGVRMGCA